MRSRICSCGADVDISRVRGHVRGLRPYHGRMRARGRDHGPRGPSDLHRTASHQSTGRSGDDSSKRRDRAVVRTGREPTDSDVPEAPRSRLPIPSWARAVVVEAVHSEQAVALSRW